MKILFLDDSEVRRKAFRSHFPFSVFTEDVPSTIQFLKNLKDIKESLDFAFLDHDLGGEEYVHSHSKESGMEVVRWIIRNKPEIGQIVVHSCNSVAGWSMLKNLREANYVTDYIPYTNFNSLIYNSKSQFKTLFH